MRSFILGAIVAVAATGCAGGNRCKNFDCDQGTDDGGSPFRDDGGDFGTGDAHGSCSPDPGNFDVPGNHCDDDGNGTIDDTPACDNGLQPTDDATAFAKALGLCSKSGVEDVRWGVVSATYTRGWNTMDAPDPNQHGILPKFGNVIKPREGSSLGVLSSGYAREKDECQQNGDFQGGCTMQKIGMAGMAPPGFPKSATGCVVSMGTNDISVLHLEIKVPNNAKGLSFDFNFFSGEWPEFVCTQFNDAFIAYLKSTAFNGGMADNVSFDAKQNPVSVNNGFFDRCSPSPAQVGCLGMPTTHACAGGDAELRGTGFYSPYAHCPMQMDSGGGATGWLTTTAPVAPGETITIDLMIWDTGDSIYDSSVLLDNFTWLAGPTTTVTTRPPN